LERRVRQTECFVTQIYERNEQLRKATVSLVDATTELKDEVREFREIVGGLADFINGLVGEAVEHDRED